VTLQTTDAVVARDASRRSLIDRLAHEPVSKQAKSYVIEVTADVRNPVRRRNGEAHPQGAREVVRGDVLDEEQLRESIVTPSAVAKP
jgi:hypothetical protein